MKTSSIIVAVVGERQSRSFSYFHASQSDLDKKFDALTHAVTLIDKAFKHAERYRMKAPEIQITVTPQEEAKPSKIKAFLNADGWNLEVKSWSMTDVPPDEYFISSNLIRAKAISMIRQAEPLKHLKGNACIA